MQVIQCFFSKKSNFFKNYVSKYRFGGLFVSSRNQAKLGEQVVLKLYFADMDFHVFLGGEVVNHTSVGSQKNGFDVAFSIKDVLTRDYLFNTLAALSESDFETSWTQQTASIEQVSSPHIPVAAIEGSGKNQASEIRS